MKEAPKVSIIVPVYKAEKYLHRCVDSILAQTFTDFELLLVDDGSPDSSGTICDHYAAADPRVHVFHKPNGGVSSARNFGIEKSKGEYITFVDADDLIANETLAISVSEISKNNIDVLQLSYTRIIELLGSNSDLQSDVLDRVLYVQKNFVLPCIWATFIKASIIKNNGIVFDKSLKLGEDQIFLYSCITHANRLKRLNYRCYYYYYNQYSASNNEKYDDLVKSCYACISFKEKNPLFQTRLDDLVLFYIEKLILKCKFVSVYNILKNLKPQNQIYRPLCTRLMMQISKLNVFFAVLFESITYPIYFWVIQSLIYLKRRFIK